SYAYWSSAFGRDPNAVGQAVRLRGRSYRIIGVAPEGFTGTVVDSSPELWIPYSNVLDLSLYPAPTLDNYAIEITARLRPGVSRMRAEQETAALWNRYEEEVARQNLNYRSGHLEVRSITFGLSPLRDRSRTALLLMLGGAGLLLLMVCANVGGLLLVRAAARERETAVRLAVGASRGRIARQRLTESVLLVLIGGSLGILAAYASTPLVTRLLPPARGIGNDPGELRTLTLDLHPDFRVVAFSIGVCALAAILSALAPAWRASRQDLSFALKTSMSDRRHTRFQGSLCAVQVALCTVLLTGAGLMARTFLNLRDVKTGFDASHVAIFSMDPYVRGFSERDTWLFQRRVIESAGMLPGIEAAAITNRALMRGIGLVASIAFPGQRGDGLPNTSTMSVSPDYFNVMGMHLIQGRGLTETDVEEEGKTSHAVVNQAFVRKFLAGQDPLGKQFSIGKEYSNPGFEVVGVVNDTNYRSLREIPPPVIYTYAFGPMRFQDTFVLHVRTRGDPREMIPRVEAMLRSLDPQMPVYQAATLPEEIDRSLWQEQLLVALASGFATFAMALSAIGLYGILAHFVAGKRREIGLRMALGAEPRRVIWLVASHVAPVLAGGLVAGAALSWFGGKWIVSLLYGVRPSDPASTLAALVLMLVVGLGSATVPVAHAIRLNPVSTLRQE
ncbi:MAG: FtsX-like permease family protein, partial [Bryobacteraceae bacterium]